MKTNQAIALCKTIQDVVRSTSAGSDDALHAQLAALFDILETLIPEHAKFKCAEARGFCLLLCGPDKDRQGYAPNQIETIARNNLSSLVSGLRRASEPNT